MPDPADPFTCSVALPLGRVAVRVDRRGLGLGERGGFDARWDDDGPSLTPDAFRDRLRKHLRAIERRERDREAPRIALNLCAHQLIEDVGGWCRLNAR